MVAIQPEVMAGGGRWQPWSGCEDLAERVELAGADCCSVNARPSVVQFTRTAAAQRFTTCQACHGRIRLGKLI